MKRIIVDYKISDEEIYNLEKFGYEILLCPKCTDLYSAVDGHPDMQLNLINQNKIIVQKNIDSKFIKKLEALNYTVLLSENSLKSKYPYDIALNSVVIGNVFMHNLKYTDKYLLNEMNDNKKKYLNVHQGYTKCSTCIVSKKAAITSDTGIAAALKSEGIDVLLLPYGDIELSGFDYGFIGGCTGLICDDVMAFCGDLLHYQYGKEVLCFLKKHKVEAFMLKKGRLTDRGSLFLI